jgi:TRAP-type C4-dicarboxylate transport system permease small subunit
MGSDWFDKVTVAIGVIMLNAMLVVGVVQVLNRYVGIPIELYWTYEVARTTLALMTIVAIPYLFRNDADISFLPVLRRITSRTDQFLLIRNVLMGALSVILVWSAYLAYGTAGDTGLPTINWFKVGWGYLLFGVAAAVLFVVVIGDTKRRIDEIRGGSDV